MKIDQGLNNFFVYLLAELMPTLREKVGLAPNTPLLLYEVIVLVVALCVFTV